MDVLRCCRQAMLRRAFNEFDTDGSGYIDATELRVWKIWSFVWEKAVRCLGRAAENGAASMSHPAVVVAVAAFVIYHHRPRRRVPHSVNRHRPTQSHSAMINGFLLGEFHFVQWFFRWMKFCLCNRSHPEFAQVSYQGQNPAQFEQSSKCIFYFHNAK